MAELDDAGRMVRVIVCDTPEWPIENLGGIWVQTDDPYSPVEQVGYPEDGAVWSDTEERFIPPTSPDAEP